MAPCSTPDGGLNSPTGPTGKLDFCVGYGPIANGEFAVLAGCSAVTGALGAKMRRPIYETAVVG